MSDAMEAEFGTVAEWTARVAFDLGVEYRLPAACRGSGSPAVLDRLLDALDTTPGDVLLDCGAGMGGPAAYAESRRQVRPLLIEPEASACRAASALFRLPVIQAGASDVPCADDTADAAWSLGVLCTVDDQLGLLRELARVVKPGGGIGLLVYRATRDIPEDHLPEGNTFPTAAQLEDLVRGAGLRIVGRDVTIPLDDGPDDWHRRADHVEAELARRYGGHPQWQLAQAQSRKIGALIESGAVAATLLHLRHVDGSA